MRSLDSRALRALRQARLRLRDLAAAEHTVAADTHARVRDDLAAAEHDLERSLEGAAVALGSATSVLALDAATGAIADDRHVVETTARALDAAAVVTERAAAALAARTRQLRVAERLCERANRDREASANRHEQRDHDDRAGRSKP